MARPHWAWFLGLLVLAGVALVLSRQVVILRDELREAEHRDLFPQAGEYVPALERSAVDGRRLVIGQPAAGTFQLLLAFNTVCQFCEQTLPIWRRLDSIAQVHDKFSVVGWSRHDSSRTETYLRQHQLRFAVFSEPSSRWAALFKVLGVPSTVLIDSDGMVRYARSGVLPTTAVDSILRIVFEPRAGEVRSASNE